MKSKKVMIGMIVVISILFVVLLCVSILNFVNIDIVKIAKNQNTTQQEINIGKTENIENISNTENKDNIENLQNDENTEHIEGIQDNGSIENSEIINESQENNTENTQDEGNYQNIQEARIAIANTNDSLSSRSTPDRYGKIYINTNPDAQPENEYEELIQYTKLSDVKISFDMDVSKTTGLSKEDFVYLVQNMKYDRTGILGKNAAFIWECCQKYSVNEIFILGICGIESAWCTAPQHQNTHNYSSLMTGGHLIPYPSDEAGFEAMIKLLGERYLRPGASFYHGATITDVGRCYCDPTSWPQKVYTCMQLVFK